VYYYQNQPKVCHISISINELIIIICAVSFQVLAHLVEAVGLEATSVVPVGIGSHSLHGALSRSSLLIGNVVTAARPTTEDKHVLRCTQQDITGLETATADGMRDMRQGEGGVARLGSFPGHRHITRTVGPVASIASTLVVRNMVVNPVLGAGDHGAAANTTEERGLRFLGLVMSALGRDIKVGTVRHTHLP
jgi:hypothetical protein